MTLPIWPRGAGNEGAGGTPKVLPFATRGTYTYTRTRVPNDLY